ncbi:MAG: hypothetical protein QFX35_05265 [Candidatus Verstraetearchaeota archaeon]|nr:hypothetical protein [Candidatus Verstraetearchaeota archaeon]
MGRVRRSSVQMTIGVGLGCLWIVRTIAEGDYSYAFMGTALAAAWLSLALTEAGSGSRIMRFVEITLLVSSICAVVVGYAWTGSAVLMALTLVILGIMLLAALLSYVLPKVRRSK